MFELTFPVGRLVAGSLTPPNLSTNDDGTPKIDPKTGKQAETFGFGIAIPKQPGHTGWAQTDWGAKIFAEGQSGYPNGETQRHDFSWKITDGDSAIPGKSRMVNGKMEPGVAPSSKTGYPGHCVLWFSGQRRPQLFTMIEPTGQALAKPRAVTDAEAPSLMKKGFFFEVFGSCKDNKPSQSPGVYLNHAGVCLRFFGEEISSGPDISNAMFGQGAAPVGATTAPAGAMSTPQAAAPAAPPPIPATPPAPPNPAFLQVATPPAPPAVPKLTDKAGGATYEAMLAAGWTDETLRLHGYMAI